MGVMTVVRTRMLATVLACTLLLTGAAAATWAELQPVVLQLDPAQTQVEYSLHSTLHTVHGRFTLARGTIRIAPTSGERIFQSPRDIRNGEMRPSAWNLRDDRDYANGGMYPPVRWRLFAGQPGMVRKAVG